MEFEGTNKYIYIYMNSSVDLLYHINGGTFFSSALSFLSRLVIKVKYSENELCDKRSTSLRVRSGNLRNEGLSSEQNHMCSSDRRVHLQLRWTAQRVHSIVGQQSHRLFAEVSSESPNEQATTSRKSLRRQHSLLCWKVRLELRNVLVTDVLIAVSRPLVAVTQWTRLLRVCTLRRVYSLNWRGLSLFPPYLRCVWVTASTVWPVSEAWSSCGRPKRTFV